VGIHNDDAREEDEVGEDDEGDDGWWRCVLTAQGLRSCLQDAR
jgi:hypothetical protein